MNFHHVGADILALLSNVELGHCHKVVFNIREDISISEELHSIATRDGWMHAEEIANQGSKVHCHHVLGDKNLVIIQPGIHLLCEFQVMKADCSFKGNKVDKLFLDGIGLQVDSVLINVGSLCNVGNLINRGTRGIIGIDAGAGINHQGC
jgi:hypothetical protein